MSTKGLVGEFSLSLLLQAVTYPSVDFILLTGRVLTVLIYASMHRSCFRECQPHTCCSVGCSGQLSRGSLQLRPTENLGNVCKKHQKTKGFILPWNTFLPWQLHSGVKQATHLEAWSQVELWHGGLILPKQAALVPAR